MSEKELFEELIREIEKKNSWGKNELKNLILGLLIKYIGLKK